MIDVVIYSCIIIIIIRVYALLNVYWSKMNPLHQVW